MHQLWKKENSIMKIIVIIKYKQKIKIVHNMKILLKRLTKIREFEGKNLLNILLNFYMLDNQIYSKTILYYETKIIIVKYLRYC